MSGLQIYDRRERALVRAADFALQPLAWLRRRSRRPPRVARVLLLRLERIGDLLMVSEALADVKRVWPDARVDLAVGAWNAPLAELFRHVDRVDVVSAPWLARHEPHDSWKTLLRKARRWRARGYDLVINFEPDIRSNVLAWLSGAPMRVGYWTGGGGAMLTDALAYDPASHVETNARALVARAGRLPAPAAPRTREPLRLTPDATARVRERLRGVTRPIVGIHVSGGRESKQWHLDRFAAVARHLVASQGATIVLTGSAADRPLVQDVCDRIQAGTIVDATGVFTLVDTAALLAELDVLISSDTGPMHVAAAVGTPVAALFGPSDPARYGPLATRARVLRVSLPCSPCGQVRRPPERCRGHVPDCMDAISVDAVVAAVDSLLAESRAARRHSAAR